MVATLGLVAPEIIVILVIARVLAQFRSNPTVDAAFYGLRPCSVALISAAGFLVVKLALLNLDALGSGGSFLALVNWKGLVLAAILLVLTRMVKQTKKLHPIWFILCSALIGVLFRF